MSALDITPADLEAAATFADPTARRRARWSPLGKAWSLTDDIPPIEYVIPGLEIGPGKCSGISAYAYGGKTPFALLMAICVASGCPFLQHTTKQTRVLYVATEGTRNALRKARRLCRGVSVDFDQLGDQLVIVEAPAGCLDQTYVDKLEQAIVNEGIGLVLIDTYGSALIGGIDHNSSEFGDALKVLGSLSDKLGVTIVPLMHERKPEGGKRSNGLQMISGSNTVGAALQTLITLTRPDPSDKLRFAVRCERALDHGFDDFDLRWEDVAEPGAGDSPGARAKAADWGLKAVVTRVPAADAAAIATAKGGRLARVAAAKAEDARAAEDVARPVVLEFLRKREQWGSVSTDMIEKACTGVHGTVRAAVRRVLAQLSQPDGPVLRVEHGKGFTYELRRAVAQPSVFRARAAAAKGEPR